MKRKILPLFLCLAVLLAAAACSSKKTDTQLLKAGTDTPYQVTLPKGWNNDKDKKLSEYATLSAMNKDKTRFFVMYCQENTYNDENQVYDAASQGAAYIATLEKMCEQGTSGTLQDMEATKVKETLYDTFDAVQYNVTGTMNSRNYKYLYTFVRTPKNFVILLNWAKTDNYESALPEFNSILDSFKMYADRDSTSSTGSGSASSAASGVSSDTGSGIVAPSSAGSGVSSAATTSGDQSSMIVSAAGSVLAQAGANAASSK